MTQTKHIRLGTYNGRQCTEIVHWGRVIAIFPEVSPEDLFLHDPSAKEFFKILETIYLREKFELKQKNEL